MGEVRPKAEAHWQNTFKFDDVVICRYAIGFMAAELFDGLTGIDIFRGSRDSAHDRRRCRGQHGIIEQYRAGYGIWHFEMTEVEGRIEAIIRASPQLVEIEEVPLPLIAMGADTEHTGAGPCPPTITDKPSGNGLTPPGECGDRFY